MPDKETPAVQRDGENPDFPWYKIYLLVAAVTVLVIASLGIFTYYFSS